MNRIMFELIRSLANLNGILIISVGISSLFHQELRQSKQTSFLSVRIFSSLTIKIQTGRDVAVLFWYWIELAGNSR